MQFYRISTRSDMSKIKNPESSSFSLLQLHTSLSWFPLLQLFWWPPFSSCTVFPWSLLPLPFSIRPVKPSKLLVVDASFVIASKIFCKQSSLHAAHVHMLLACINRLISETTFGSAKPVQTKRSLFTHTIFRSDSNVRHHQFPWMFFNSDRQITYWRTQSGQSSEMQTLDNKISHASYEALQHIIYASSIAQVSTKTRYHHHSLYGIYWLRATDIKAFLVCP